MFEPKTGITVHLLVYNQHILGYATKVFGNYLIFGNVRVAFGQFLENVRKSSKSYRKSSETRQKCYQYVDITKIKNTGKTWLLVDMEYFFSCSTRCAHSISSSRLEMMIHIYYISQLVRTQWLVNLAGRTLLYGPLKLVLMPNCFWFLAKLYKVKI